MTKNIQTCNHGVNFYCPIKKHTINNGYAIACHCSNCDNYVQKVKT